MLSLLEIFILKSNILILTSNENFIWTSMQEIIPSILETWEFLRKKSNKINLSTVNTDKLDLNLLLREGIKSDFIVIPCFNQNIARSLVFIKEKFKIDTPLIFYIHGFASIGCWPLLEWGFESFLDKKDIFIVTCKRDIKQLGLSLHTQNIFKVPFYIKTLENKLEKNRSDTINFYTISRISEQKNIEVLLYALNMLKKKKDFEFKFQVFGKEDHLGHPNLGLKSANYLDQLKSLTHKLDLSKEVIFHGFIDREQIPKHFTAGNNIFLSASLHSDENFGVSVFRALSRGHNCIISDWGGHRDYLEHFPALVRLVKTTVNKSGPHVEYQLFYQCLIYALEDKSYINRSPYRPSYYCLEKISLSLNSLLESSKKNKKFSFTPLAKQIYKNRLYFKEKNKNNKDCQIYSNHYDPLMHLIYSEYSSHSYSKNHEKSVL